MKKHQNGRKALRRVFFAVVVVFICAGLIGGSLFKINHSTATITPSLSATNSVTATANPLTWPATGQAAIGITGYGVLDSTKDQKPAPTASVAKLITALTVLEKKPIASGTKGGTLTIGATDIDLYHTYVAQGGSVVPVNSGEQLSQYDALVALLLPSANNIADSMAIWTFGSLNAYATYANAWLANHGLTNTHVGSDASGLSETTTSTATDLVKLGLLAHANPTIAEISAKASADIPVAGTVNNVNWLLGTAGITGLKTGNSDAAGGTYVFSADYVVAPGKTVTIVGAVLQSPDLRTALTSSLALLTSSQKNIAYTTVVPATTLLAQYNIPTRSVVTAVNERAVNGLFWSGKPLDKVIIAAKPLTLPAAEGTSVGTVKLGNETSKILTTAPAPNPSWWWRLIH